MTIPLLDLKQQQASLGTALKEAIERVLASTAYVNGPAVAEFEEAFAAYCGTRHAIGCANGTDALEIALVALGIGRGDRVVTVSHTFVATVEAIVNVGAEPVLVDVDPATLLMDPKALDRVLGETERVRAVIPVHLYGGMVAMDHVLGIARKRGLAVIEDSAQAHGARYQGQRAGSFGDLATFSFFPGKNLGALGDAGAIVTSDDELHRRAAAFRDHGRTEKYLHQRMGRNSRLDSLQAAVLTTKLGFLDRWNEGRRAVAERYHATLPAAVGRVAVTDGCEHVYHQYVIRHPKREALRDALKEAGVASGIHYPVPVHRQPAWRDQGLPQLSLPHTELACEEVLSLPVFPELTEAQQSHIVEALGRALA